VNFATVNERLARLKQSPADRVEAYLRFLCDRYDVGLNLHDIAGISEMDERLSVVFAPYLYHNNPFCNYLKKNEAAFRSCARSKNVLCRMCSRTEEPFYGSCYMGVEEMRFPIRWNGRLIAFLCVGQFCSDPRAADERLTRQAAKYGLDAEELKDRYRATTKPLTLDVEELHAHVGMLSEYIALLYEKFLLTARSAQNIDTVAESHKRSYIVHRTVEYIKENYMYPITLKALASGSYCSEAYLSHLFKEKTGQTITEYINKLRVQRAKQLLDVTSVTVTDIAHQCGFNDSNYFARVFRQHVGKSPKQYRERRQ